MPTNYTVQSIVGRRVVPDGGCIEYRVRWACDDQRSVVSKSISKEDQNTRDDDTDLTDPLQYTWESRSALLETCASAVQSADQAALNATDLQLQQWHERKSLHNTMDDNKSGRSNKLCACDDHDNKTVSCSAQQTAGRHGGRTVDDDTAQSGMLAVSAHTFTQRTRAVDADTQACDTDEREAKRPCTRRDHLARDKDTEAYAISISSDAACTDVHYDANRPVSVSGTAVNQLNSQTMHSVRLGDVAGECDEDTSASTPELEKLYGLLWQDTHTHACLCACESKSSDTSTHATQSTNPSYSEAIDNSGNTDNLHRNNGSASLNVCQPSNINRPVADDSRSHTDKVCMQGGPTAKLFDAELSTTSALATPTITKAHASAILLGELILSEQASLVLNNSKRGRKVGGGGGDVSGSHALRLSDKTNRHKRSNKGNNHHNHSYHHNHPHHSSISSHGASSSNATNRKGDVACDGCGRADLSVQAVCEPALHLENRWRELYGVSFMHSCAAPHILATPLQEHFNASIEPDSVLAAQERAMAGDLCIVGLCPLDQSCSGKASTYAHHVSMVPMIGMTEMERLKRESTANNVVCHGYRNSSHHHHYGHVNGSGSSYGVDSIDPNHYRSSAHYGADNCLGSVSSSMSGANHAHLNAVHELVRDRKEQLVVRYLISDHISSPGDVAEVYRTWSESSTESARMCANSTDVQAAPHPTQANGPTCQQSSSLRLDAVDGMNSLWSPKGVKPRSMITSMPLSVFRFAFPQLLLDYLLRHALVLEGD